MELHDPRAHGFDAVRLARVDRFIAERYLDSGRLLGAQLLVSRDGRPVLFSSLGAMREGGQPTRPDTIYRIASMTKPVTSVAFMMLVEEGRVALDDRVDAVVPEFANLGVYAGGGAGGYSTRPPERAMTMLDLLRHTAGLTYGFQNRTVIDAAYREAGIDAFHGAHDLAGMARALGRLPLEFSPGAGWNYSMATDVLGLVLERIEGRPLDELLRARIFAPLGMADTGFTVAQGEEDRLADCHALVAGGGVYLYDEAKRSRWLRRPRLLSGGGGLVSTTADYHRFCRMLLGGGACDGVRLLAPRTVALMTANHLPGGADLAALSQSMFSEATDAGTGFGLGFGINLDPVRTMLPGNAGDFFWGGMFSTAFFVDPAEGLIAIFMAQLSPSSAYPVRRELRTMIYAALADSRA